MKNIVIVISLLLITFTYSARGEQIVIASGPSSGTYYQLAESLKDVIDVVNISTQGSRENIDLVAKGEVTIAFVQLDILIHLYLVNPTISKKVKIVMPVYNEVMHIISHTEFSNLEQMSNKRLALGANGSGTRATAEILVNAAGLRGYSDDRSSLSEALKKLKTGNVDVVFQVSRVPDSLLANSTGISFLSISKKTLDLLEGGYLPYRKRILSERDYSWLDRKVITVQVPTVMVCSTKANPTAIKSLKATIDLSRSRLMQKTTAWKDIGHVNQQWIMSQFKDHVF